MSIAGLKTRFLVELMEYYGEAVGRTEQERLLGRLSARHRLWFAGNSRTVPRPEVLFLEDVEEVLAAFDDTTTSGPSGSPFETAVEEVVTRGLLRRSLLRSEPDLRASLSRLIPYVEDFWPIRPPTITLDESERGLRIAVSLSGYSRCTRLLAFQMLGALKAACRLSPVGAGGDGTQGLRTTMDFFGDRARIDVHRPQSTQAPFPTPYRTPSQRPSNRSVRLQRTSLSQQVESILGHRSSGNPPPSRPSHAPPNNALGMAQLGKTEPPREPITTAAPPPSRTSHVPPAPPSFRAPRVPVFDNYRRPTPPPSQRAVTLPEATATTAPVPASGPAPGPALGKDLPESRTRLLSEPPSQSQDNPPAPSSRRGGGSR